MGYIELVLLNLLLVSILFLYLSLMFYLALVVYRELVLLVLMVSSL